MHTGVNTDNRRLTEAKMRGCQVRYLVYRKKRYVIFTNSIHDMCQWKLINVYNVLHLVGNQRNVTMTAYGNQLVVYTQTYICQ